MKFYVQTIYWSEKIGSEKKFGPEKHLGVKIIFVKENFGLKQISGKKIVVQKLWTSKKIFVPNILGKRRFKVKKRFDERNYGQK